MVSDSVFAEGGKSGSVHGPLDVEKEEGLRPIEDKDGIQRTEAKQA